MTAPHLAHLRYAIAPYRTAALLGPGRVLTLKIAEIALALKWTRAVGWSIQIYLDDGSEPPAPLCHVVAQALDLADYTLSVQPAKQGGSAALITSHRVNAIKVAQQLAEVAEVTSAGS